MGDPRPDPPIFTTFMSFAMLVVAGMFIAWNGYLLYTNQPKADTATHDGRSAGGPTTLLAFPVVLPCDPVSAMRGTTIEYHYAPVEAGKMRLCCEGGMPVENTCDKSRAGLICSEE